MELFKLWDSDGNIIAENATEQYCNTYIREYAKERGLGLYYRGHLLQDGTHWIDYGSHTHFFYMKSERLEVERSCARYEVLDDETNTDV
jgi:hypothetical protein